MALEKPESNRKGGGGKLSRSVIVTVRMDSQLHYLAELAARKHRRTLSSFIEWAVQHSFNSVELEHGNGYGGSDSVSLGDMETRLWDVDPAERFARLAILYPDLLTHEEQERWKLLSDSQLLAPAMRRNNGNRLWDWPTLEDEVFPMLRRHWAALLRAHEGGPESARKWVSDMLHGVSPGTADARADADSSPPPMRRPPAPPKKPVASSGFDDMDDDIPF